MVGWTYVPGTQANEDFGRALGEVGSAINEGALAVGNWVLEDLRRTDTPLAIPGLIFENRSREPDPLPEAEGRPHSRPDPNGGYTEYGPNDPQTGRPTGTRQYRPAPGREHGNIPRPNVKERPPTPRPDGTVQPGRPQVRPPREDEHRRPPEPQQ